MGPRLVPPPRNHDDDAMRSLIVPVVVFSATAVAMSVAVVVAGSDSWADATPLIVFVSVFALTKVILANALFYVMLRSDAHSEAVAAAALKEKAAGTIIRRPHFAPGLNRLNPAANRRRKPGAASNVRLAIIPRRKPPNPPPHRTDR
jgi:hypothetical protein